jgi:hypothetical protein
MSNFETDLMADSDVETEQSITTHLNLSTKRGRPTGSKTTKKTGNIYGRPRKQIRGQSSIMAFTKRPQQEKTHCFYIFFTKVFECVFSL